MGDRRVECKSSQFRWDKRWLCFFSSVKFAFGKERLFASFDQLILTLYTPRAIFLYDHDFTFGVSTRGAATLSTGHVIVIGASTKNLHWSAALDTVLEKLDDAGNKCERIATIPLWNEVVRAAELKHTCQLMDEAYTNVPLSDITPAIRGRHIEKIVRVIDSVVHRGIPSKNPLDSACINGSSRGLNRAQYDWLRGNKRVECKASQLFWDGVQACWKVCFHHVKIGTENGNSPRAFDELFIAIYSPIGIDVYAYACKSRFGVCSVGKNTETRGFNIQVYGPSGVRDWLVALSAIQEKLRNARCTHIAHIMW